MQKPPRHTQWGSLVWLTLHANSFGGRQATDNTSVRRTTWRVTWCLYQPFSPEHQQRFGCQESFITTCFWPLLCNQHHLLMCAHYTFCFLPPSFPSFLLLLLLFLLGGRGTSRFLVPGRDDITCSRYSCSTAGPRGGRWAAGSPTGIPTEKTRKKDTTSSQPPVRCGTISSSLEES